MNHRKDANKFTTTLHLRFIEHSVFKRSAMSKLEKAIVSIVEVFEEYAGKDDDKKKLNNSELSTLIKAQLSSPDFKSKVDSDDICEALDKIDKNRDGQVSFKEFSTCVARLAEGYFKKRCGKDKGKCKQ